MPSRTLCAIALGVCIPAPAALAGPDSIAVLLGSHHLGDAEFEEVNPGIFLNWHGAALSGRVDLGFGAFRNSYGNGSVAFTAAYPVIRNPEWGLDVFAALAWYPGDGERFAHAIGDIVPLGGVQARWRNVFVQAIPGGGRNVDAVFSYGLVFELE